MRPSNKAFQKSLCFFSSTKNNTETSFESTFFRVSLSYIFQEGSLSDFVLRENNKWKICNITNQRSIDGLVYYYL
jgi:hypothetical protein